jgi:2-dehydropantoate 2-reductase
MLAESGSDITLVSRGDSFKTIKEKGIVLNCADGIHHIYPVKIIDNVAEITDPDLIILAVKSYDLEKVSQNLVAVVKPETIVITIQNGLDNENCVPAFTTVRFCPDWFWWRQQDGGK